MNLKEIEKKLQVLEDIENIKKLKARYCRYCDNNYDADGIASLFTEDGVWEGGKLFGKYKGKEEIKKYFQQISEKISFAIHAVMTPIIEVKGNTAKGTWYLLQSSTLKRDNQAVWGSALYDENYAKVDGEWKFKRLRVKFFYWTPYKFGWAKKRIAT